MTQQLPTITALGLLLWGVILLAQNASFTMVSRARNSGSDWYHAIASVFSNGVWFVAFYFTWGYLDILHDLHPLSNLRDFGIALLITFAYIVPTVTGSVLMGKFLRNFFERGKRRVGHYDDKESRIVQLEDQVRLIARILEAQIEEVQRENAAAVRRRIATLQEEESDSSAGSEQPTG